MRISLASISVGDQEHALAFYTEKLGFIKQKDIPMGDARWLTLVSPEDRDGPELLLEPNAEYPAMKAFKESLVNDGIPFTAFSVGDVQAEFERLDKLGVTFKTEPTSMPGFVYAVFDDTCGNLIQIYQETSEG